MEVVELKVSDLKPYDGNAKVHTEEQIAHIVTSIERFGMCDPVGIWGDENIIVEGHGRLEALKRMGKDAVPCIRLDHLTDEERRAYTLAHNQTCMETPYDLPALKLELDALANLGWDMRGFGFDLNFADGDNTYDISEDDFDGELPEEPTTRLGDVWQLGRHRLMCGDSTMLDAWEKLMAGEKADLVFSDPPYGVSIGDKNKMLNKYNGGHSITENIENDCLSPDELYKVLRDAFTNVKLMLKDCASVYVTAPQGGDLGLVMWTMMKDAGLPVRHNLVWVKNAPTFSMGRLDYEYQHEPIMYTWNKTHKKIMGGKHKTSCWFIDRPRESKLHPTMKPIELVANAILNSSEPDDVVIDAFGGSGSTLIACEQTGRSARLMELDPKYCDVIVKRWEDLTGGRAELITANEGDE